MRKKLGIMVLFVLINCICTLIACGGTDDGGDLEHNHTGGLATCGSKAICSICGEVYGDMLPHSFTKKDISEQYLLSEATCEESAVYYYSCACGEKGVETFEVGKALGHDFENGFCKICEQRKSSDGLTFKSINNDAEYEVVDAGYCNDTIIFIPSTYKGKKVTSIGDSAFSNRLMTAGVIIPDSVTKIGDYAFSGCSALSQIELTNSLVSVGKNAFYGCNHMEKINYLGSIEDWTQRDWGFEIFHYDLYVNSQIITDVKLTKVTKISDEAFFGCVSLKSIEIPDTVERIGKRAFYGCNNLTKVNYIGSIDDWVEIEFGYEYDAPLYNASLYINNQLVTKVKINNAKKISSRAFYNCTSLTNVTIGNSVESIGAAVFYNCSSLKSIEISNSVESIGEGAFNGCNNLTKVNYIGTIDDWVEIEFNHETNFSRPQTNPVYYAKDLYINNQLVTEVKLTNAKKITDYAFYNCSSLKSVEIPNSATSIGNSAFYDCKSLTSIVIPNSVTSIGSSAFYDCKSLTSIVIPNSVINIGYSVFYNCSSLKSVEIPNSVTSIGGDSFKGCTSLQYYTSNGIKYLGNDSNNYLFLVGVEDTIIENIQIDKNCKFIGYEAFRNCGSIDTLIIPDGVTIIDMYTFRYCGLRSITIPNSVNAIYSSAFEGCYHLEEVIFDGTIEEWNRMNRDIGWNSGAQIISINCNDGILNIG